MNLSMSGLCEMMSALDAPDAYWTIPNPLRYDLLKIPAPFRTTKQTKNGERWYLFGFRVYMTTACPGYTQIVQLTDRSDHYHLVAREFHNS